MLFMDFPDAVASHSTRVETGDSLAFAERYLEEASYGRLDIEFVPLHRWLRSVHEHAHYLTQYGLQGFDSEAVRLADPDMDFSDIDVLMAVLPSEHFGGGTAIGPVVTDEGVVGTSARINSFPQGIIGSSSSGVRDWGRVGARALLRTLGIPDLRPVGGQQDLFEQPPGKPRFRAEFGLMGLTAYFLLDRNDRRTSAYHSAMNDETLAWTRWQLGWLDPGQVDCFTGEDATVELRPVARDPGPGTAMAAIPLTATEVIVLESRRAIGRDAGGLLDVGVLVYTVNASIPTGHSPMTVVGVPDEGFPVLQAGESMSVRGYTIAVTADRGNTHTVRITRAGQ